jgi:glyoxylase-like metal-dependent hydrolase (beta-lactamase superfamily II)
VTPMSTRLNKLGFALGILLLLSASLSLTGCEESRKGYYHLVKRDSVWWFASPGGDELVSLGVNHIEPVLLASEKNRAIFEAKYGADLFDASGRGDPSSAAAAKWMDDSVALIRSWGFNTVGVHNPIPQRKLPYVAKFRPARIDGWAGLERRYMDPFDPRTGLFLKTAAAAWCAKKASDPLILGVSFNDMPIWRAAAKGIHEWVRFIMGLGADAPGKRRWVQMLRKNYPGPAAAGAAYGVAATAWEEILERTRWGAPKAPWAVFKDVNDFLPEIADAWYGAMSAAIRSCDKNHLVFGDKFEGARDLPTWMYPIIGRHFDLSYIQWYAKADAQEIKLAELHAATGKPILMGDSSFSHPNENVRSPKGVHVASDKEVGRQYAKYLKAMMKTPYVVGWHFCGFIEGSPDLKKYHPYFAIQSGFLRPDGTPYRKTLDGVVKANSSARRWHEAADADRGRRIWAFEPKGPGAMHCRRVDARFYSLSQVDNNVFNIERVAMPGLKTPNKNISWVVTDEGVVVIDAGLRQSGIAAKSAIRSMTDKPIKYIVYTHHHGTQVGGAREIADPETKVIAHEDLPLEFDAIRKLHKYNARLNSIQFNNRYRGETSQPPNFRYPDITYRDTFEFTLGGTKFELHHVVGEAQDYTVVYLPAQKIVWVADLVGPSVPLIGSPMKIVRDDVKWRMALEKIKSLRPEVLISSVGPPMCEPQQIDAKLDATIEYFNFLNDAVSRELNNGSTLEQALANIRMPEDLARNPWLGVEKYGNLNFNVKGMFSRYSGWFDRNGTSLDRAPAAHKASAFVADMGGRNKVLARILALEKAQKRALALEYVDLLLDLDRGDKEAHEVKGRLLLALGAEHIDNPLMFKMYNRLAIMEDEADH